jgi:hypothetical protein
MPPSLPPEIREFTKKVDQLREQDNTAKLKKNLQPVITPAMNRTARFLAAFSILRGIHASVSLLFHLIVLILTTSRVPIITMSVLTTQNARLITVSLFVVAFAAFLSLTSSASNHEVLAGSAAYAAVLVVFIGSALSNTPVAISGVW